MASNEARTPFIPDPSSDLPIMPPAPSADNADSLFGPDPPAKDKSEKNENKGDREDSGLNDSSAKIDEEHAARWEKKYQEKFRDPESVELDYNLITNEQEERIRGVLGRLKGRPEGRQEISAGCLHALCKMPDSDLEVIMGLAYRLCDLRRDFYLSSVDVTTAQSILADIKVIPTHPEQ